MNDYFIGAKSQYGEGKVHQAHYSHFLNRYVATCQKLNPLKKGYDAYDGTHVQGIKDLTCKRCLANAEESRWEPLIKLVMEQMWQSKRHIIDSWSRRPRYPNSSVFFYAAERAVKSWVEDGNYEPDLGQATNIAENYMPDYL